MNLGPPDYESGATNQLSYGSVLFRSLFRCREAVVRTGAQKYINSVEMQKKAENANILFNIMNEQRAKRGYKRRKGIAAFREGYEQHGKHGGVKRDGKKNGKKC